MSQSSRQPVRTILLHPLPRLIDISTDLALIPCPGMVVKRLDEDSCTLFMPGQAATDGGFLIDRPWDAVIDEINGEIERAIDEAVGEDGREDESDEAQVEEEAN